MDKSFEALLAAAVAALVSYFISNRNLSDSLDSKSGWRAKLFDVASKYELTLDDAQTVRAALRIFPSSERVERYSFTWFSNVMIVHLDKYILNEDCSSKILKGQENKPNRKNVHKFKNPSLMTTEEISDLNTSVLNVETTKVVRLFTMFLLKYHFDYRSSMGAKDYLFMANKDKNKKFNPLVAETFKEYLKLVEEMSNMSKTDEATKKEESPKHQTSEFIFIFSITMFITLMVQRIFYPKIKIENWSDFLHPVIIAIIVLSLAIAITAALLFSKREEREKEKVNKTEELDKLISSLYETYKKQ